MKNGSRLSQILTWLLSSATIAKVVIMTTVLSMTEAIFARHVKERRLERAEIAGRGITHKTMNVTISKDCVLIALQIMYHANLAEISS
jgi:hypothetical protein